jgi:hypothetical protein
MIEAASAAIDSEQAAHLKREGDKLRAMLENYTATPEGAQMLEAARARLAALHDDRTMELAHQCKRDSKALLDKVMASDEGKELVKRQEILVQKLSALKDNEDAKAILDILKQKSDAVDASKLSEFLNQVDLNSISADNLAANSEEMLQKLQSNKHVQEWLNKGESILGSTVNKEKGHELLLKGQHFLSEALEKSTVQDALRQGLDYQTAHADVLSPSKLVKNARTLLTDRRARDEFVRKVKDAALAFLMQYLPKVKVKPVHHDDDSLTMNLSNIDLSGFAVPSDRVDVILENLIRDGIQLRADSISCSMPDVLFSFKQKGFPYMSGDGKANIEAKDVQFALLLKIEFGGDHEDSVHSHEIDDGLVAVDAIKPTAHHPPSSATHHHHHQTAAAAEHSKQASSADTLAQSIAAEHDAAAAAKREWKKLGRPRLVIASRALKIGKLTLTINMANSWLTWAYNSMIAWCNTMVRQKIEKELLDALDQRTGLLLTEVNELSREYWPILLSLSDSASQPAAAHAESQPASAELLLQPEIPAPVQSE